MSREENIDDATSILSEQIKVDPNKGSISPFGITIPVGKPLAYAFNFFYEPLIKAVSEQGGRYFGIAAHAVAKNVFHAPDAVAEKARAIADPVGRYGLLTLDIGVGVGKTITSSMKHMREVNTLFKPYLAANHNSSVGAVSLASDNNPGIINVRRALMQESKSGLLKNLVTLAVRTPSLLLTMWDQKLKTMDGRKKVYDGLSDSDKAARMEEFKDILEKKPLDKSLLSKIEEIKESEKYEDWLYHNPKGEFPDYMKAHPEVVFGFFGGVMDPANLKNTFNQLFRPKTITELTVNRGLFNNAPYFAGIIKQFASDSIGNRMDLQNINEFAAVQIAKKAKLLKEQPAENHRELAEEIREYFIRHFKDSGITKKEPDCEKLGKIGDELAVAIIDRGLNPYALIDLVCGNKLVKYSKGGFIFTSAHDRTALIEKESSKYSATVDNADFYKDAGIKPEDLGKIYSALPPEERGFFVMLMPPGILEQQGIDKGELTKVRRANRREFADSLSAALVGIKDISSEDMQQKYGMSEEAAKMLLTVAEDFAEAAQYGSKEAGDYLTKRRNNVAQAVLKAGAKSKDSGKFWQDFVKGSVQENGEEANVDNGSTSSDDALPTNRVRAHDRKPRTPMDHAKHKNAGKESGERAFSE